MDLAEDSSNANGDDGTEPRRFLGAVAMLATFIVHRSFVGFLLWAAYFWFSATYVLA